MFVRTERLTLRPGWREDAPELAQAIGHESVVRNLARAPWPYALGDAEQFLAGWTDPAILRFLIFAHEARGVALVGCIGIDALEGAPHELGYWLTPGAWGRGYATEAGRGVLRTAQALGIRRVDAGHFADNPASGRVLRKLGFRPTGETRPMHSRGRGSDVPCVRFALSLDGEDSGDSDPDVVPRMAA